MMTTNGYTNCNTGRARSMALATSVDKYFYLVNMLCAKTNGNLFNSLLLLLLFRDAVGVNTRLA